MHRWFRFCAVIALMGFAQSAFAQSNPEESASGSEVPVSKHRIKPTPTQVLQHALDQQGKRLNEVADLIAEQTKQIEAQGKQMEELAKRAELQTKQIETLNGELNRLTAVLLAHKGEATAEVTPVRPQPHVQTATSSPLPVAAVKVAEPVSAEPKGDGSTHVIKRGENLISVARQHGTTVAELLKINKIEDERKLQIGQTLILPKTTPPNQ